MQFDVKEVDSCTRQITLNIEPDELSKIEADVIRELKKSVSVPGFRKGKVPTGIIKKRYADHIKSQVADKAISHYYQEALVQANIEPLSQAEVSELKFNEVQSGLEAELKTEVEPKVELKKYRGLKVEKEVPVVTDSMMQRALNEIRNQFATKKEIDEVKEGSLVNFNVQELGEGDIPIVGKKMEDVEVEIGSGEFDAELEKQMIGLKFNEEAILRKTTPPAPESQDQHPQTESYKVIINLVEQQELPPLDDELAKNLQEGDIETLEQLKERIRENLKRNLEQRSRQQFTSRLIDELLRENPFDVPNSMVEHYLNHVIDDIKKSNPNQNFDEGYIRQKQRSDAIQTVRWYFLKDKIAKAENLEVTPEEIDQQIESANLDEGSKKQIRSSSYYKDRIREDILTEKVIKFLEEHADITEVYPQEEAGDEVIPSSSEELDQDQQEREIDSK